MRSTDHPPAFTVFPTAATQPMLSDAAGKLPLSTPISLGDRLKAIGLVTLISGLGLSALLVGSHLLNQNAEETLQPLAGASSEQAASEQAAGDRVPLITPVPIAPSESAPALNRDRSQSGPRSPQPGIIRPSREFGAIVQPNTVAVSPIPAGSASAPTKPQSSSQAALAAPAAASRPFPAAAIAALLQAPASGSSTVAIIPGPAPLAPAPPTAAPSPASPPFTAAAAPAPSPAPAPTAAAPSPAPAVSVPSPAPAVVAAPLPALRDRIPTGQLQITGSTRFSQAELVAIVQKIMKARDPATDAKPDDQTLSPAELVQASEAITRLYTDRGYINSGAFVPADVLTGAKPEIRVVEGSLEAVNVKVEHPFLWLAQPLSPNYVQGRLNRNIQMPLQIDQLADAVKFLEQDPMIGSISTQLAPGTTLGKSVLNVKVRQAAPLRATLSIDNSRAPSVGTFQQRVGLTHANILGLGDRWQISYNRSAGSQTLDFGFSLPLNARNGTLSLAYTTSRGEVIQEPFRDLGIKSRSQNYEIGFRQPIYQTSNELFALSLRGTHYRNRGVFLEAFNEGTAIPFPAKGSDIDGNTRITALRFGQEWLKRGERDVLSLQSEFNLGINALNSTQLSDPPDGRFFYWRGSGFWVHAFAPDTLFALKGQLQFASRPLVPVEQISLGGINTVRGYQTDVLLGDNGWFASAEFYIPVLRIPRWQGLLQVVPFIDAGRAWNLGFDQPDPSQLLSVGLGLQWKMGDKLRARLDWGVPLMNSTAVNGQSLQQNLFFSIIFTP